MGSTNGTFVNGVRVGVADLRDGDLIAGGQTVLRVSLGPAGLTAVPPRPSLPAEKETSVSAAMSVQGPAAGTIACSPRQALLAWA